MHPTSARHQVNLANRSTPTIPSHEDYQPQSAVRGGGEAGASLESTMTAAGQAMVASSSVA